MKKLIAIVFTALTLVSCGSDSSSGGPAGYVPNPLDLIGFWKSEEFPINNIDVDGDVDGSKYATLDISQDGLSFNYELKYHFMVDDVSTLPTELQAGLVAIAKVADPSLASLEDSAVLAVLQSKTLVLEDTERGVAVLGPDFSIQSVQPSHASCAGFANAPSGSTPRGLDYVQNSESNIVVSVEGLDIQDIEANKLDGHVLPDNALVIPGCINAHPELNPDQAVFSFVPAPVEL